MVAKFLSTNDFGPSAKALLLEVWVQALHPAAGYVGGGEAGRLKFRNDSMQTT